MSNIDQATTSRDRGNSDASTIITFHCNEEPHHPDGSELMMMSALPVPVLPPPSPSSSRASDTLEATTPVTSASYVRLTLQNWHASIMHIKKGFQHHEHGQGHQSPSHTLPTPLAIRVFLVGISIAIGVTLVLQVGANTRCGHVLGNEIRGSFIHFTIMTLVTGLFQIHHLREWMILFAASFRDPGFHWWHFMGGVLGAVFVALSIVLVDQIGFALFFVAAVAGQVITSLAFDTYGIMGYRKIPLRRFKIIGVIFTIVGCVLLQDFSNAGSPVKTVLLTLASLLVGGVPVLDAAVNNAYALLIRKPMAVAWVSFATGAVCLVGVYLVTLAWVPFEYHSDQQVWWQWSGGFLGAVFIISALYIPPAIGVATFFVSLVCGQLAFSLVSDAFGIFGPIRDASALSICGLIVAFAGAVLVSLEHKQKRDQQPDLSQPPGHQHS